MVDYSTSSPCSVFPHLLPAHQAVLGSSGAVCWGRKKSRPGGSCWTSTELQILILLCCELPAALGISSLAPFMWVMSPPAGVVRSLLWSPGLSKELRVGEEFLLRRPSPYPLQGPSLIHRQHRHPGPSRIWEMQVNATAIMSFSRHESNAVYAICIIIFFKGKDSSGIRLSFN